MIAILDISLWFLIKYPGGFDNAVFYYERVNLKKLDRQRNVCDSPTGKWLSKLFKRPDS